MNESRRNVILLVDDDDGDVLLLREALRQLKTEYWLDVAWNGEEALDYLKSRRPDMIVMDMNLPRMGGRELLEQIKAQEELRDIPLIVLTTSTTDQDVLKGLDARRNLYLTKPMRLEGYLDTSAKIEAFWSAAARAEV